MINNVLCIMSNIVWCGMCGGVTKLPGECRLQRIKEIAGPSGQDDAALDALMTGDFDPDQYDKQMAAAFGDNYYEV